MDITHLLKPIKTLRSCIRQHEGGGGQCATVSEEVSELLKEYGADTVAGFFVTRDGEIVDDHWWIKSGNGYILDPTQDQFGDSGFGDVVLIPPKHPQQAHYFPYKEADGIPYEVIDFAENLKERLNKSKKAGLFSKLVDDYGGRPVGDPNSQSSYDMPEFMTTGGHEAIPDEGADEEKTPEEFQQILRNMVEEGADLTFLSDFCSKKTYNKIMEETLDGGAGVLIYDPIIKRILVQKRKDDGLFDFFGGTLEEGETSEQCARREAYEEGGLKFPKNSLTEVGIVSADKDGDYDREPYIAFLYKGHAKVTKLQKKEVTGFKWIKPEELNRSNSTWRLLKTLSLGEVEKVINKNMKEVDHPEFMPGGNEEPRYDPNLYLGNTKDRHQSYNTGHPDP